MHNSPKYLPLVSHDGIMKIKGFCKYQNLVACNIHTHEHCKGIAHIIRECTTVNSNSHVILNQIFKSQVYALKYLASYITVSFTLLCNIIIV